MNGWDILIALLVLALVGGAVFLLKRGKKKDGCCGDCGQCGAYCDKKH